MRAAVIDRVDLAINVSQQHMPAIDFYCEAATGWKISRGSNAGVTRTFAQRFRPPCRPVSAMLPPSLLEQPAALHRVTML